MKEILLVNEKFWVSAVGL